MIPFSDTLTIRKGTRSSNTTQYSVSYPNLETSAQGRIMPLNQRQLFGALGSIPTETFNLWLDASIHVIEPGDQVVHDNTTYEVTSVETHRMGGVPQLHRCLIQRLPSG